MKKIIGIIIMALLAIGLLIATMLAWGVLQAILTWVVALLLVGLFWLSASLIWG